MTKYRNLSGQDATRDEVVSFVELVQSGGAVDEYYVRQGLKRPGAKIVFAEVGCKVVGVAALKIPSEQYRFGLQGAAKADYPLSQNDYPFELGYVSVSPEHSGQGIARKLIKEVLLIAGGKGIFATTSHPAMKNILLPFFRFAPVGKSWINESGDVLHLLVRKSHSK